MGGEYWLLMQTLDVRPFRYDLNQSRAVPVIPIDNKRWMSTLWARVSNAADISRKVSMVPFLLSSSVSRSDEIFVSAVSVDLRDVYALCSGCKMLLLSR